MANVKSKQGTRPNTFKNSKKKKKTAKKDTIVSKKQQSQQRRERAANVSEDKLKKTGNKKADERRSGAARAQNTTAIKAARGAIEYVGQKHAQSVTKAFTSANKRAAETAGHGNRGKSGQPHSATRSSDRGKITQIKVSNTFKANEKKNRAKEEAVKRSNYKGNAAVAAGRSATKKLERANEKSLEMGASGFSNKKHSVNVPVVGKVEFSNKDIYKGSVKLGNEMLDYAIPYGGTAKGAIKAADAMLNASKAAKAGKALTKLGEKGGRELSDDGINVIKNVIKKTAKNGERADMEALEKRILKSDLKDNIKRELLANAMQDATIGTGIDLTKGIEEGYTGKDLAKYMGENALLNIGVGIPISAVAGRTGKAGKAALKNQIESTATQATKAVTEENRIARRLGAKGLSPEEVQKAVSKKEVQEYIDLSVKNGKTGLTVEQKNHLNRLTAKVEAQKKAYDDAITESVKATRASIGQASAVDVARLRRAVAHYEMSGNTSAAKDAQKLLVKAEKNVDKTLDTITKASARISNDLGREFKVETADECLSAFAKTGGRVNDPSKFHGFAEFDNDGNIVGYHVNKDSEQALEYTFGHEFMHGFESLGNKYDDFVTDLKDYVGEEWDDAIKKAKKDYANVENADFEKEAVANLVARHFFAEDGAYLKKLAGENPSLFSRIYDFIKKLIGNASESDTQFKALSKQLDEMFDSLSKKNQEIIKGSPDYTELMFTGEGSARAYGDKKLLTDLDKAKDDLEKAIKKYGDSIDKMSQIRRDIFKNYGWFEGLDGKWRYEISDAAISWKKSPKIQTLAEDIRKNDLINIDETSGKYVVNDERAATHLQELETLIEKNKLTKKEQGRIDTLESKLRMYELFTNGLPIGEVINHPAFFKLYPEALKTDGGGIRVKLDTKMKDNEPAFLDTETKKWDIKRKVWLNTGADESVLHLNANFFNTKSSFYDKVSRKYGGSKVDKEMKASILHELQHYVQEKEGFSKGADVSYYRDPSIEKFSEDNIYPKNFEKDADKLNQLNKAKLKYEDALWMIDGGEADAFMNAYREIKNLDFPDGYKENPEIEDLLKSGDKKAYVEFVYKELRNKYKIKIPSKEFRNNLQQYLYKDFSAGQIAERNPKTLYDQTAGEIEAFKTEERLWSGIPDEKNPDTHGRKTTMEERRGDYPIDIGQTVRFKEYPTSKGTTKGADIDSKMPNRRTRNDDGLVRRIADYDENEKPTTRRSQTMSDSESAYYESLASDVEAAERELQDAMSAYNPADSAPVKGQMTDEVRAQIKAQNLGGKELTDEQVETLAEAQVALHNTKVIIPESAQNGTVKEIRASHGIAEDNVMLPIVKSSTAKNAQSVGDAYAALSKEYPDLFPSSITSETEQFQRLMDVSGLKGGAQSRRGNYYVPKNRTMTPYKPKTKATPKSEPPKAEKPKTEKPKEEKPKEPATEPPKEKPKQPIERERRDNTKKRENETARKAFKTLDAEYGKDQGWVDAVTGKREDGAFGKLKVKGAAEAAESVDKEFNKLGYDKLKTEYFKAEVADDPYVAMARANKLLGEIDRRLKAGEGEPSALYDEATDIIEKYSGITTLGSNILSSAKKFLTSTPQGRKRVVMKEIERLEKRYKDRLKGKSLLNDSIEAKIDELMHASGAKADEILDEINTDLWEQIPASLMERMNEYRHCFMLFNVKTHGRNIIGNSVFRLARAVSDDMERRILNSNAARKRIGKMQGGKDPSDVIINRQKITHKELKDNYTYLFNEFHAIYDKSGSRNKFIETGRPDGVDTVKFKAMQKLINLNYAALEKEDLKGALIPAFNKSYLSYCKARCPEGTDLRKFMENMTSAQKEKAQQYALMQGEYATFRDSCAFSDWLTAKKTTFAGQKGKTKWGTFGYRALDAVLEGALPFVKTPVNIFRRSVDYSPASLVMSLGKLARAESPEMFQLGVHQFCTGLTGTAMAGFGVFLAHQGLITVRAGEESGDAYYDRDMGYQDYSIKINLGGKQYSWTLDWMSPMNMSLFAGAAFEKMFEKDGFDNTASLNAFFAITSPITDMSFMSSPKDTMERFLENASRGTDGKETDFAGALAQLIVGDIPKNYVTGFFPQLMSQFAGATDEYRRDTKSTRENVYLRGWESSYRQIINKIPWAREALLNPKLNRRGEDVKNDQNIATRILNSFFNPANVKEITTDDQDRELINIRNHIKDKNSNLYKYFYYNFTGNPPYDLANGKRMTYKESYKYAKASRVEMNDDIKNMLGADSYKDMSWDMKANEVDGTYWIGKSVADKETYGFNYAMKALRDSGKGGKKDYNVWKTYKENAGGSANKDTYWNYYVDKERLYNRSHPVGDNTYRIKGLPAIQSGDQALIDSVGLDGHKEPELKHYWEVVQKKFGKKAKEQANKEYSDGSCIMTTNLDKAGVESTDLGMLSASAGVSAKKGKKIEERVYRGLGQFWNSAQAGGGLMLKYNDESGKYDLKNLEKLSKQLNKKIDNRADGVSQKDVVCEFIEKDLGVTDVDEAACLYQTLYAKGRSHPASKTSWKNPYKDKIDDHLEWGEDKDDEWGGIEKGSRGGRGRRGRRRGGRGGGGGSGGGTLYTPLINAAGGGAQQTITKVKVTDVTRPSNYTKPSNLNDAYRKKAKKYREQTNKKGTKST